MQASSIINLSYIDRTIFNHVEWLRKDSGTFVKVLKFALAAFESVLLATTLVGIIPIVKAIKFLRKPVYKFTELARPSKSLTVKRNDKPCEICLPFVVEGFKITDKYLFIQEKSTPAQIHYKELNTIERSGNWRQLPSLDSRLTIGDWECKDSYVIAKCWRGLENGVQYTMKTITLGMKSWGTAATLPKNEMIKSFGIKGITLGNNRLEYIFLTGEGKLHKQPCD